MVYRRDPETKINNRNGNIGIPLGQKRKDKYKKKEICKAKSKSKNTTKCYAWASR